MLLKTHRSDIIHNPANSLFDLSSLPLFLLEGVWYEAEDGIKYAQAMKDCKHINFQGVYAFCGNAYEGNHADVERLRDETIGE